LLWLAQLVLARLPFCA